MSDRGILKLLVLSLALAGCVRVAADVCWSDSREMTRSFVGQNGRFAATCRDGGSE